MELENYQQDTEQRSTLHQVTPLSKYLAMTIFIIMPFVAGYIGYQFAPEKMVEVEKVVVKEVGFEKEVGDGSVLDQISVGTDYVLERYSCTTVGNVSSHDCFRLWDANSNEVISESLSDLARGQGIVVEDDVEITSVLYQSKEEKRIYFLTGIPNSGGCCRLLELDIEQMKFSARDDLYKGPVASEVSSSGRFVASAVPDELTTFRIADLETSQILFEDVLLEGSLNSTVCALDGNANDIAITEDESLVTYGVYSTQKVNQCDYRLLEKRKYKIENIIDKQASAEDGAVTESNELATSTVDMVAYRIRSSQDKIELLKGADIVQTIPWETHFEKLTDNDSLLITNLDINFDHYLDLGVLQSIGPGSSLFYHFYTFDPETHSLVRETTLGDGSETEKMIASPLMDVKNKTVTSCQMGPVALREYRCQEFVFDGEGYTRGKEWTESWE